MRPTDWSELPLSLKAEDVASVLGVSRSTVHRLIASGRLSAVRLSERRILVSKDALMEFMGASAVYASAASDQVHGVTLRPLQALD